MSQNDPNLIVEVFNQRAGILTFFGMLGGSVRALVLKTTWREGLRVILIGGAVAFGVGVIGPVVMEPWIGKIPDGMAGALGTLTAASFLIGLVAVTLVERLIAGPAPLSDSKQKDNSYYRSEREREYKHFEDPKPTSTFEGDDK